MYLSYEITKRLVRSRFPQLSLEDFEDRYHDTWEIFLRYPPPPEVNELTAFLRMWHSWYNHSTKRNREYTTQALLTEQFEEELHDGVDNVLDDSYTLLRLLARVRPKLSEKMYATFVLLYQGYTQAEVKKLINLSMPTISDYYDHVVTLIARESGYSTKLSRYEVGLERDRERHRAKVLAKKLASSTTQGAAN